MAEITQIKARLAGADNVYFGEILQGEQHVWNGTVIDNPESATALDISGYQIQARAEFGVAGVTGSGESAGISSLTLDPTATVRDLDITVLDQSVADNHGRFSVVVPADLYTAEVAYSPPTSPVAIIHLRISNGETPALIRKSRIVLAIRRAL